MRPLRQNPPNDFLRAVKKHEQNRTPFVSRSRQQNCAGVFIWRLSSLSFSARRSLQFADLKEGPGLCPDPKYLLFYFSYQQKLREYEAIGRRAHDSVPLFLFFRHVVQHQKDSIVGESANRQAVAFA
jgi:hypothetical protein